MLSRVGGVLLAFSFSLLASPLEVEEVELQAKEALENCLGDIGKVIFG